MIKVLYVDDEQSLLDLAMMFIEPEKDITLITLDNASDGLRLTLSGEVDVIVSDYQMPGMDGLTFLKELRAQGMDIPFILFTGKGREEVVIKALNEGADFYLQKGGHPLPLFVELVHKVRRAAEQRATRIALRESEAKLRRAEEVAGIGHWWIVLDEMMMYGSKGAVSMYGLTVDRMPFVDVASMVQPEDRPMMNQALDGLINHNRPYDVQFRMRRPDGQIRYFHSRAEYDSVNRIVFGVLHDINDQKTNENDLIGKNRELEESNARLAESEEMLRRTVDDLMRKESALRASQKEMADIIEFLPDATFVIDREGKVIAWNKAIEEMTGLTNHDMLGKGNYAYAEPFYGERRPILIDLITKDEKDVIPYYGAFEKKRNSISTEVFAPHLFNGEGAYVWETAALLVDDEGNIIGSIESICDITDQKETQSHLQRINDELWQTNEEIKKTQDQLRRTVDELTAQQTLLKESEEKFSSLVRYSSDPIYSHNLDGTYKFVNEAFARLIGRTPDDIVGRSPYAIFSPKEAEERLQTVRKVIETRQSVEIETKLEFASGDVRYFLTLFDPVIDEDDRLLFISCVSKDITERKHTELALQESEWEMWRTIDNSPVAISLIVGPRYDVLTFNKKFTELFGYSNEEVPIIDYWWPKAYPDLEYRKKVMAEWDARVRRSYNEQREMEPMEVTITCKDHSRRFVEVRMMPLKERQLVTFMDLTKRKKAQEALQVANKKLNLLGSVSMHDTLNRLTALKGNIDLLGMTRLADDQKEMLRKISASADAIANISKFTKQYQEIGLHEATWKDLHHYIEDARESLHQGYIRIDEKGTMVKILADPMFQKVVHNLIENVVKHGQRATLITVTFEERNGKGVIVFEDDGAGISATDKEKLFQPDVGKNTGFGLFLSREILDITGIEIQETSQPGHGARFEITVPSGYYRVNKYL